MDKETILDLLWRRITAIEHESEEIRKLVEQLQHKEFVDADSGNYSPIR